MNFHIDSQIKNMIIMTKTFNEGCKYAAQRDDGIIDKEEAKILKKINAAAERFISELEKINN